MIHLKINSHANRVSRLTEVEETATISDTIIGDDTYRRPWSANL
jgi:hypothetical protein